jgi:photosystem II stability/assembly factor-like uncharacterized protein
MMAGMTRSAWCSIGMMAALAGAAAGQTGNCGSGPWVMEQSGTTAGLRGIHAVNASVAWASGTNGTILRTVDGGATWQRCAVPPNAEKLDFRGIWAWDAQTAIAMSSGPGDASRLYKTTDGCASWTLVFTNSDKDGFWDAMVFQDRQHGFLLGDPVKSAFALLTSDDGGKTWSREHARGLKANPKTEGAFAASNSELAVLPGTDELEEIPSGPAWAFFGTGGNGDPYVFADRISMRLLRNFEVSGARIRTRSRWFRVAVPLAHGSPTSGVFSLAFRNLNHGVAVGGDYTKPNDFTGSAAWSADSGKTWTAAAKSPHGFRSAVAWDADANAWITVGTNGSDMSYDDGKTWVSLDNGNWNALSLPWAVGPGGRIGKLDPNKLKR